MTEQLSHRPSDCKPCELEQLDASSVVFRDDLWACEVVPGFEVPGWFSLRLRRHAEYIDSLTEEELASFGRRTRDVVAAVSEVTGAPRTYVLSFNEHNPHFHALVAARSEHIPPEYRMGNLLSWATDHADRDAALALVPDITTAYQRLATGNVTVGR